MAVDKGLKTDGDNLQEVRVSDGLLPVQKSAVKDNEEGERCAPPLHLFLAPCRAYSLTGLRYQFALSCSFSRRFSSGVCGVVRRAMREAR